MKKILILMASLWMLLVLTVTGIYLASGGDYQVPRTVDQDPSLPSVTLDGVTFHAEAFGDEQAPVVVVLHGGPGNDYRYLLDLKALADQYRVVFYDQRGTGLSPRVPEDQLTLENMISDVDRIVQHFGGGKPVRLIGHSWGAMLAAPYLGRHPEAVSHVVLAEPGLLTTDAARAFMRKFKIDMGWNSVKTMAWMWFQSRHVDEIDGQERDDYFFTNLLTLDTDASPVSTYFCNGRAPRGAMKAWRYNLSSNSKLQSEGTSDLVNHPIELVKDVDKYKGKTLFLASSCNKMIGEDFQREFHLPHFPGAEFKVIEGSGHLMFSEKPTESVAAVREFLAR